MTDGKPVISGKEFNAYLAQRIHVDEADFPAVGQWSGAGDTFGAIALKMNLISMSSIDVILEAQANERLRFGQLAVKLGMINEEQAARILELQRFHRSLETGERLVVHGKVTLPDLLRILADFLEARKRTGEP